MDEAGRVIALLPHFVANGARLVPADVGDELVDGRNHLVDRVRPYLITSQLVDLAGTPLDVGHG
jgi:hypothetical protein